MQRCLSAVAEADLESARDLSSVVLRSFFVEHLNCEKEKNRALLLLLLLHLLTQILRAASFFVAFANLVSSTFFLNAWLLKASFANICKKKKRLL